MRLLRSGDALVFLPPLTLSGDPPRRHGRRWARSCGHHACCRRGQLSLNYELDLRLHPRLVDDVVNFPEAFALKGPSIPRDHLVTWNSRREYPRYRRASDSFLRTVTGTEIACAQLLRARLDKPCCFQGVKAWKHGLHRDWNIREMKSKSGSLTDILCKGNALE